MVISQYDTCIILVKLQKYSITCQKFVKIVQITSMSVVHIGVTHPGLPG